IRRKSSFIRRIDSSEECPSPHDSIYEAYNITASDESSIRTEQAIAMVQILKAETQPPNDENERIIRDADFRYGRGTVLDTITEKHSNGTIRSIARPKSADNVHYVPFLGHRDSFIGARSPRRRLSFSMDDVQLINQSYHEVCHEIYASPKIPLQDPVDRPGTPPGMPSWTAAQTARPTLTRRSQRNFPSTPNRFQRFLGIERWPVTFSSRVPYPDAVRDVSAPINTSAAQQAPRFRPPRSAYGLITRHPFNNAPIATVSVSRTGSPMKKVRFTPSTTARDSAEINLRNAVESTATSAFHPMAPIPPMPPNAQASSTTTKHRLCLHRKKNQPASSMAENVINVQTSINVQVAPNNSTRSAALLMSGARSPGLFPGPSGTTFPVIQGDLGGGNYLSESATRDGRNSKRFLPCLKCFWGRWVERAGNLWANTSRCLCFVCCGYECDDNSTVYGGHPYETASGYFDHCTESRRDVLEQTPASMV
ncbi:hypothetical protein D0Z07_0686, partial [Hyphodiscus hymeniophilus]